jgi:2-polyprenyl-6-methoxyphenol hydroxylase-like FAD-dependent oxidoreductase
MDPITGQGIGDALRDAELLAGAVEAGLGRRRPLAEALAGYERARDRADYLAPRNLLRVLGIQAMATTMLARLRQPRAAAVA